MMQFETFLVENGQKMPNFSHFLECSNPIKTRMKQFDTFLVENVYLKNTKSELFPPKTLFNLSNKRGVTLIDFGENNPPSTHISTLHVY